MKKLWPAVATLLLALPGCEEDPVASPTDTCGEPLQVALVAGRTTRMGTVTVSNSETTLYVQISCDEGWAMTRSQVAVGCALSELPQTRSGNPIPGRFPYKDSYCPAARQDLYAIPLSATPCGGLFIAVHADVIRRNFDDRDDDGDDDRKDDRKDDRDDDKDDREDGCEEGAWGEGEPFPGANWAMFFKYSVQRCRPPSLAGQFRTHSQSAWSGDAASTPPGAYLARQFDAAFPQDLTIGASAANQARFTTSKTVRAFLPQAGTSAALTQSYIDPPDLGNALAGETVALTLNVTFDRHDPEFGASQVLLADLVVADPASPCFGLTVGKMLSSANLILGGQGQVVGLTPAQINDCLVRINENFDGGADRGFLRLP